MRPAETAHNYLTLTNSEAAIKGENVGKILSYPKENINTVSVNEKANCM
jgi:hypothetical protein